MTIENTRFHECLTIFLFFICRSKNLREKLNMDFQTENIEIEEMKLDFNTSNKVCSVMNSIKSIVDIVYHISPVCLKMRSKEMLHTETKV